MITGSAAPVAAPLPAAPAANTAWAQLLHAHGLRATRISTSVLALLQAANRPLSHHDILQALQQAAAPLPNKVTLYRLLDRLVRAGLLRKLQGTDRLWRFATAGAADAGLFECDQCHQVSPLPSTPQLPALLSEIQHLLQQEGLQGNALALTVHGVCKTCSG